jgi:hypothetical protein
MVIPMSLKTVGYFHLWKVYNRVVGGKERMKPQNKILNALGFILFFAGVLLGMVFSAGLIWANLEANFYFGFNGGADTKLRLACPHIMTPQDSDSVIAIISNKVDKTIEPILQADFSGPMLRSVRTKASIDPGKTEQIRWAISAEDLDYGHLIMAQVYQYSSYKTSTATATCGTLFLTIPALTGMQVYILVLGFSLFGIATGVALWLMGNWKRKERSAEHFWGMIFLTVVVFAGILVGSMGLWVLGIFALALSLLIVISQVSRWLMS